ncbi:MAG: glycosyltransferase [Acidimicrobiales bacterium]
MNVVYDLLGFQSRDHGERGIARYVLQLGLALERTNPGLVSQYLMHPDLPFPAGAEALVSTGRVIRRDRGREERRPSSPGVFIAGSPFESFHFPSEHVLPSFTRTGSWRSAAVVHDLIPGLFPDLYLGRTVDRYYYRTRVAALATFDHLLANSQASADDAVRMLAIDPDHITVIGAGADNRFQRPTRSSEQVAAELVADGEPAGLRPGYVLFPSGIDPRKNVERTIHAYGELDPALRRAHQLVLACRLSHPDRLEVERYVREAGVVDDFLATGYVSDDLLCRLYQGAHLVVFPSLYEGFGLPVLEAMKCGAPVICADSSSLKEVQTRPAARFDPTSSTAIAEAMTHALVDHDFRQSLRDQGLPQFSWENAARLTAGVIRDLAAPDRCRVSAAPKPRLALFAPLRPRQGEVARYAARLVDELRHRCDLTVFTPDGVGDPPPGAPAVEVAAASRFDLIARCGGEFDGVVYLIDDSPDAVEALRCLRRRPGHAILLDPTFTQLYSALADAHPDEIVEGSAGRHLGHLYPGRYRPEVERLRTIPSATAERFGIVMGRELALWADCLYTHSDVAANLVQLDTGVDVVRLSPQPCPEPATTLGRAEDPILIASFGSVSAGRQLPELVEALAVVRRSHPDARLCLVGPIDVAFANDLVDLARVLDVGESLAIVPADDEDQVAALRREVTLAVQLHDGWRSSSASVSELLAYGTPTVVTDLGDSAELPDEAVVKVGSVLSGRRLGAVLAELAADRNRRVELGEAGRLHAKELSFANAAARLLDRLSLAPAQSATSPFKSQR